MLAVVSRDLMVVPLQNLWMGGLSTLRTTSRCRHLSLPLAQILVLKHWLLRMPDIAGHVLVLAQLLGQVLLLKLELLTKLFFHLAFQTFVKFKL